MAVSSVEETRTETEREEEPSLMRERDTVPAPSDTLTATEEKLMETTERERGRGGGGDGEGEMGRGGEGREDERGSISLSACWQQTIIITADGDIGCAIGAEPGPLLPGWQLQAEGEALHCLQTAIVDQWNHHLKSCSIGVKGQLKILLQEIFSSCKDK